MALPVLQPGSNSSKVILPATGTATNVASTLPFGMYSNSPYFITGAADQVAFTYKMLGGDVLDIELTEGNVYAAYETSVLEYSYIVNLHQAKNTLGSLLGQPTGSFNELGNMYTGSLSGTNPSLKFPKLTLAYERRFADSIAYEVGQGGSTQYYSASIPLTVGQQDYDVQAYVSSSAATLVPTPDYAAVVNASNNARIRIAKVYFRSPHQIWRFFGNYGGLTAVGNLNTYGQYCLIGDTKVAVPQGGFKTLKALSDEGQDKTFDVFAYDPIKQTIVKALGRNAHLTKPQERCFKVIFQNDQFLVGSSNHKLMMLSGEYRQISDLKPGDKIMSAQASTVCCVKEIIYFGQEDLYDITVDGFGNFVIELEGVVLKNLEKQSHEAASNLLGENGLVVVGNSDDSTFDIIPAWQNKLQAVNYSVNLKTRASHYSYKIINNKVRLYPAPITGGLTKIWVLFSIDPNPLAEDTSSNALTGIGGVSNLSNLPFDNLPYESINSMGKQWVRKFCLSVTKAMLAQIRGKFQDVPIPGDHVTLNATTLGAQAIEEMEKYREELKTQLEELTYAKIAERNAQMAESTAKTKAYIPKSVFLG